jgi:hypothetical protein
LESILIIGINNGIGNVLPHCQCCVSGVPPQIFQGAGVTSGFGVPSNDGFPKESVWACIVIGNRINNNKVLIKGILNQFT